MTQNQIWSMHSTDSLWGDEDSVAPLDEDAPQPPETWLMLEFCDRGSLLVCHPPFAGVASSLAHALLLGQLVGRRKGCCCGISFR